MSLATPFIFCLQIFLPGKLSRTFVKTFRPFIDRKAIYLYQYAHDFPSIETPDSVKEAAFHSFSLHRYWKWETTQIENWGIDLHHRQTLNAIVLLESRGRQYCRQFQSAINPSPIQGCLYSRLPLPRTSTSNIPISRPKLNRLRILRHFTWTWRGGT